MSEVPDFCPNFETGPDLSFLNSISTEDIMKWLKRNRAEACIICTTERRDKKNVRVKTFLQGKGPELEIMIQDIKAKAEPIIYGRET